MQPHSMCAVALANYVWNSPYFMGHVEGANMNVSYQNSEGKYRLMKYELSGFNLEKDNRTFSVFILRGGGGISCKITATRGTAEVGAKVSMTHSQNHVSGLREEYTLNAKEIANGRHYNSQRYRNFSGENAHPDRLKLKMRCEVRVEKERYITIPYELEITSVKTKRS